MILNWIFLGTPLEVWRRLFYFNLAMISFSLILYYFTEKTPHLYMAGVWCLIALLGLFIKKGLLHEGSSS